MSNMDQVINTINISRRNKLIIFMMFIMYPLGALPFIIWGIYNRKKYAYFLFALFLGLTGMLYAPNGDLYRYYQDYYTYSTLSYSDFSLALIVQAKVDFGLPYLQWIFAKIGLSNDLIVFLFISIGSYFILSIIYNLTNQVSKKTSFLLFIICFLSISFWGLYFRYGFASVLFTYGCFLLYKDSKKIGYLIILLSFVFHWALIISILIFLAVRISKITINKKVFAILVIASFIFSSDLFSNILLHLGLPPAIQNKIDAYTGEGNSDWLNDRSIGSLIINYFNVLYKIVIYFIIYKSYRKDWLHSLLSFMILAMILLAPFATIVYRIEWTFRFVSLIIIIPALKSNIDFKIKLRNIIIMALCVIGIVNSLGSMYMKRFILPVSEVRKVLYWPSFTILSHQYSEDWLKRHAQFGE